VISTFLQYQDLSLSLQVFLARATHMLKTPNFIKVHELQEMVHFSGFLSSPKPANMDTILDMNIFWL